MENVTFADILTQYAMQEIDDINWSQEIALSPARFLRAKSDTVINAIPLFSRPPEMHRYLTYSAPEYDDYLYEVGEAHESGLVIATGKAGFETCSVVKTCTGEAEEPACFPIKCRYDVETGDVTILDELNAEDRLDIDFYTDAVFDEDLSEEMCSILGTCIALKWFSRFANTWLNMTPKVTDKTFSIGSESAQMTSNTNRMRELRAVLNDKLLRFEQSVAYENIVPNYGRLKMR